MGSKVNQQHVQAFCVWSFENQNEWNPCFLSGSLLNSPQKNTDSHFAIWQVQTLTFFSTTELTSISKLESCVFYLGRGFFKFFSFNVCFVTFRLFLPLFLNETFTWVHGNLCLLVGEEMLLVFSLYSFSVLSTPTIWARHSPLQKCERTGKEYGCFPFVWKTKIFKWKINYILESLPRIEVFGGGKWQNGSSTNITQNREFVWIG